MTGGFFIHYFKFHSLLLFRNRPSLKLDSQINNTSQVNLENGEKMVFLETTVLLERLERLVLKGLKDL